MDHLSRWQPRRFRLWRWRNGQCRSFWDLCYGAPYTRNEKNRSSETPMLPGMLLNLCQIASSLTEQCGHETFQISGFWADYRQTAPHCLLLRPESHTVAEPWIWQLRPLRIKCNIGLHWAAG